MSFGRKWKNWGGFGAAIPEGYRIVQVHVDVKRMWKALDSEESRAVIGEPIHESGLQLGARGVTEPILAYKLHREVFEAARMYPDLVTIKDITSEYQFFRTACPPAYDGHSVLEMEKKNGTRVVAIRERDVEWFIGRCGSGLHAVVPLEKWEPHFGGFGAALPPTKKSWAGVDVGDTYPDVIDAEKLAEFLAVPTYTDVWEGNEEYLGSYYSAGMEEALNEGLPIEEAEEAAEEAQYAAEEELLANYTSALEAAADSVLEPHKLVAEAIGKHQGQYKIVPTGTWKDAAWEIIRTINGIGMFYYEDAKALKDVGPYRSYKQAVLSHLHWVKDYPKVYGTRSAERVFHNSWR
jgi:hypothetical protein